MSANKTWTKVEGMEVPDLICYDVVNADGIPHILGGNTPQVTETHSHFTIDFESKQFVKKAALPVGGLNGCSGVYVGKKIYLVGGNINYTSTNKLYSYDTETNTWSTLADIPVAGTYYSIGAVGDYIYVCGGVRSTGAGYREIYQSLFRYDIKTNVWEKKANLLAASLGPPNLYYYEGALYFLGGGITSPSSAPTIITKGDACQKYVIHEDKWYFLQAPPTRVILSGSARKDDKIYLVGGNIDTYDNTVNTFYEYSLATNSWIELENFPISIAFNNALIHKNKIYVVGGSQRGIGSIPVRDIYSYGLEPSAKLKIVLEKGKTIQLKGLMLPQGFIVEEVDWTSGDDSIAAVDETGLVTAVDLGEVRITVEAKDKSWKAYALVKVVAEPEYHLTILLQEGESCQLTIDNTSDKKETWISGNPAIVSVTQDGKVTAIAEGISLITVSIAEEAYTEDIFVMVEKAPPQV